MNDNDNNQPMLSSDNHVSKVKNESKTKNEAFIDTLEWCCQALYLDNCPQILGGGALNAANTWACLHDLTPQVDGQ